MRKYLLVSKNTWLEIFSHRLNFVFWRVRHVIQLLIMYFLWEAVFFGRQELFGYSRDLMLTYILGTQIVYAIVMTTRTQEVAGNINKGELSNFLIKPIGYFRYWFFRDLGDKIMNIIFSTVELSLIFLLLKPPVLVQFNPYLLLLALISIAFAISLNFLISCILSMIGFWSAEIWAPRFIFFTLLTFFTGGLFPLDIFPKPVFEFFMLLPFAYLQYFTIKIYLGQLQFLEILKGLFIALSWMILFFVFLKIIWKKGLKLYTAAG